MKSLEISKKIPTFATKIIKQPNKETNYADSVSYQASRLPTGGCSQRTGHHQRLAQRHHQRLAQREETYRNRTRHWLLARRVLRRLVRQRGQGAAASRRPAIFGTALTALTAACGREQSAVARRIVFQRPAIDHGARPADRRRSHHLSPLPRGHQVRVREVRV